MTELVRFVALDAGLQPVEGEHDGQTDGDLGCGEALYLDGSISSLYTPQLEKADDRAKLGPMFAVTE